MCIVGKAEFSRYGDTNTIDTFAVAMEAGSAEGRLR